MTHDANASSADITHVHPEYARLHDRWKMSLDFWLGGISVLMPDWKPTPIRYIVGVGDGGETGDGQGIDSELPQKVTRYAWRASWSDSYLFKNAKEPLRSYQERGSRAVHFPLFQRLVNVYVSAVLRMRPQRKGAEADPWKTYYSDVTRARVDIDQFVRSALAGALDFGRMHAVTDRPRFDEELDTKEEQKERGDRPYSYLVSPLALDDWLLDEQGRFIWAKIREVEPHSREPGQSITDIRFQYRVWYRDHWELWREKTKKRGATDKNWYIYAQDEHPVGEVPIATLWATREHKQPEMAIESPFCDGADMDREIFNRYSELDELERSQTFEMVFIPQGEFAVTPGPVDLTPFAAWAGDPGASAPTYFGASPEHPVNKWNRIKERLDVFAKLYGASRGQAENSKEERSAEALLVESSEKRNMLANWSESVERFDRALARHVAKWEGLTEWPKAVYDRQFSDAVKSVGSQVNDMVQLATISYMKPAVVEEGKAVSAHRMMERGATEQEIKKVAADIDKAAEKEDELKTAGSLLQNVPDGDAKPDLGKQLERPGTVPNVPKTD